jgi:hypothetical protein
VQVGLGTLLAAATRRCKAFFAQMVQHQLAHKEAPAVILLCLNLFC